MGDLKRQPLSRGVRVLIFCIVRFKFGKKILLMMISITPYLWI